MEKRDISLTVITPALNEEALIERVVLNAADLLENRLKIDYEIFIFNDGSTDKTGLISDSLAEKNPHIKVFHNDGNKGIGYSVRRGIAMSTKKYVVGVHADDQFVFEDIEGYFERLGDNDMVIGYIVNLKDRNLGRRFLSRAFVLVERIFFGIKLRYTNGMNLYRVDKVKNLDLFNNGHAIWCEMAVKLMKKGASFTDAGFNIRERAAGESQAVSIGSIIDAIISTAKLWKSVR